MTKSAAIKGEFNAASTAGMSSLNSGATSVEGPLTSEQTPTDDKMPSRGDRDVPVGGMSRDTQSGAEVMVPPSDSNPAPQPSQGDQLERAKALVKLKIIDSVRQQTRDDPVSLALKMPYLQSRLKAWEDAKGSGDAGAMTKSYNDLLRGIEAEQNRRGIPKDQQRVLSNELAEDVARSVLNAEPAKMLEKYQAAKDDHGEYASGLKKQIDQFMPKALLFADQQSSKLMGELVWRKAVSTARADDLLPELRQLMPPPRDFSPHTRSDIGDSDDPREGHDERRRGLWQHEQHRADDTSGRRGNYGIMHDNFGDVKAPPPKKLDYDSRDIETIAEYKDSILWAAKQLGVSPDAIAGCIAEELDDARQNGALRRGIDWGAKQLTWWVHGNFDGFTHDEIEKKYEDYEKLLRDNPDWETDPRSTGSYLGRKATYPTSLDLGMGKIRLHTAIRLLREYNRRYPETDPLNLKKYNDHYDHLANDLASRDTRATAALAGLMVEKATRWFTAAAPEYWARLKREEQAALIVDYYNFGEESILKRYRQRAERDERYEPTPGESGKRHLVNQRRIHDALGL